MPSVIFVTVIELLCGFVRIAQGLPPFSAPAVLAGMLLAPLFAALLNQRRAWDLDRIAARADEWTHSRDRFATYRELARRPEPSTLEKLALAEAREFAARCRLRPPAENWWCLLRLAPLGVFALALQLAYFYSANQSRAARDQAAALLAAAAPQVAALGNQWREPSLEKAAERLQAEAAALTDRLSRDPRRDALEALARSEESVRELAGNFTDLRPAAEALAEAANSPEMGEAVEQGNYARAAEAARQAPEEQMRQAIERAAAASRLPELTALREAANPGEAVAQLMEKTARSQERNREMQKLLSALRDLKLQPDGTRSPEPDQADQSVPATGEDAATASMKSGQTAPADGQLAAAESPSGDTPNDGGGEGGKLTSPGNPGNENAAARPEALAGIMGPGVSLQDLVLSGADNSEAKRRYQAIYQAAQSDEAAAVERESIPARSRQTVKRYLESIRPAN